MEDPAEHFRRYRGLRAVVRRQIRDLPYGRKTERLLREVYEIFTTPITLSSFSELRNKRETEKLIEDARKRILFSEESTSD